MIVVQKWFSMLWCEAWPKSYQKKGSHKTVGETREVISKQVMRIDQRGWSNNNWCGSGGKWSHSIDNSKSRETHLKWASWRVIVDQTEKSGYWNSYPHIWLLQSCTIDLVLSWFYEVFMSPSNCILMTMSTWDVVFEYFQQWIVFNFKISQTS